MRKGAKKAKIIWNIVTIFVAYNFIYYLTSYYVRFPMLYAKAWRAQDKALSLYLKENEQKYDKIIFDREAGFVYTSLLFYQKVEPLQFQKTAVYSQDDSEGFSNLESFGKYEFKEINWTVDTKQKNALIVTTNDKKPSDIFSKKIFYYPTRPIVLSIKEKIAQYPTEEVAYVVFETEK